jgi:predicted DNA-binding transcriptional regulator YafY
MNNALSRQWAMLRHIPRYPRRIDATALRRKLEDAGYRITLRSIQRDLIRLSTALPLMSDHAKPQGWSWREEADQLDLPYLEPQAALTFHLVERYLRQLLPESTLKYLSPWFRTARTVLEQNDSGITTWPDKVRVVPRGPRLQAPAIEPAIHSALYEALLQERQLKLCYLPRHAEDAKEYQVHPLGVVVRDQLLYLVCTMWDYADVRQLALHRVRSAELVEEPARRPPGFDLDAYIEGGAFGYTESGERIELVALFGESAAAHLYECRLSEDQRLEALGDGRVRVTATVLDTMELRWWLLAFGEQVQVLAPSALRDKIGATARSMAALYESGANAQRAA